MDHRIVEAARQLKETIKAYEDETRPKMKLEEKIASPQQRPQRDRWSSTLLRARLVCDRLIDGEPEFASVAWEASDLLDRGFTEEEAVAWYHEHERALEEAMVVAGWHYIDVISQSMDATRERRGSRTALP